MNDFKDAVAYHCVKSCCKVRDKNKTWKGKSDVNFIQVLMLVLVVTVWILIYRIWREVDIFLLIGEPGGEALSQIIFEKSERDEGVRIINLQDEKKTRNA